MNKCQIVFCSNISKSYKTIEALKNVSLSIDEGEKVAFIGANGAGKSTLFNAILGLTPLSEGNCTLFGVNTRFLKPEHRSRIFYISDNTGPVPWASSADIADFYAAIYHNWDQKIFSDLLNSWGIDKDRRLNCLSKGQKRLAEFALMAACKPELIILDEPFEGLDAVMRILIQRLLKDLNSKNNTTIVFASHILSEIPLIADRVVVLRKGIIVTDAMIKKMNEPIETVFRQLYKEELC